MAKEIAPTLGAKSYSCPHCGALAQQYWFHLSTQQFNRGDKPQVYEYTDSGMARAESIKDKDSRTRMLAFLQRLHDHELTYQIHDYARGSHWELCNAVASLCDSCDGWALWVNDEIVYPPTTTVVRPHDDMPAGIKSDFEEAANIVDRSPRGAAALLRLCVQKIVMELGQPGENLNNEIGELVRSGKVDVKIQQALDVVRVVGNDAVHPGEINFKDNKGIALQLFELVNLIVETAISAPRHIATLFETMVPEEKRKQIEKRDAPKEIEGPKPAVEGNNTKAPEPS